MTRFVDISLLELAWKELVREGKRDVVTADIFDRAEKILKHIEHNTKKEQIKFKKGIMEIKEKNLLDSLVCV